MAADAATFDLIEQDGERVLAVKGDWTVDTIRALDESLRALAERIGPGAAVDVTALGALDVAGAYLIDRTVRGGSPCGNLDTPIALRGTHHAAARLLAAARRSAQPCETAPARRLGILDLVETAGRGVDNVAREAVLTLSFFGETLSTVAKVIARPKKIRWTSVVAVMEHAGLNALPIIATLSFFVGMVVAYIGARTLQDFGATVFTVDLIGIAVMREFGVVICTVLLAGRTGSAFTAEIGSMKMRQEIDAMRVMGLDPMEALVAPRVFAMMVMTPLLTFAAVIAGLLGGVVACATYLDISPAMFFARIQEAVPAQHFWVGMMKSPAFALVISVVGCRHGLAVGGDVASLGKRVTTSVVQAIFLIVMLDALFALWFLEIDL
ncbi:MAG: ABC transporter permease [Hydrogenophilaceae bacterium]|jgi:phospholipid/cholesterol/gamma-HCH transport system permease protein|nr:ABC transporter permease [Hydrogenophilaceae bacterium]